MLKKVTAPLPECPAPVSINFAPSLRKYKIHLNAKESLKSTWKREVKRRINEEVELELRQKCNNSTKARIVKEDKFERKGYLQGKVDTKTAKKILRARLNMCKLPANYKQDGKGTCHLCEEGEGTTEHYFRCVQVNRLKKVCGVKVEHLMSQDMMEMRNVANFLEKVEIMCPSIFWLPDPPTGVPWAGLKNDVQSPGA